MKKVSIYESFEALPEPYEKLFIDAGYVCSVFLSLSWFRNLIATVFQKNKRVRIYGLESDSGEHKLHLALPLSYEQAGIFAPRKLTAAANFYSPFFAPAIGTLDACIDQDLTLLVEAIAMDRPRWDSVDLHPMAADTPLFNSMLNAFRMAGMATQRYFCFGNWYLEVNGRSYDDYFGSLPSKLKNTVQRKSRQLEKSNRAHIKIISSVDDVAEGIAAYEKIYNASWKTAEPYPAFMPGLIHTCAEQGWLRLGVAYIDGQPAAAQIWIVYNGVASIYKLAYDEQFSQLSIGSILTARLMRHAIDVDRVREVDYLTGDEPYKREWMSHRRERWGIIAFNLRTMRGVLAAARHLGAHALKNIVRSRIGRSATIA